MDKVINLAVPHISEQIFESINTDGLIQCLMVGETWRLLAENVLVKRWKENLFEACAIGKTQIVQLLLECFNGEEIGLNTKREFGITPLMAACSNGHIDTVKLLLNHSDIELVGFEKKDPQYELNDIRSKLII